MSFTGRNTTGVPEFRNVFIPSNKQSRLTEAERWRVRERERVEGADMSPLAGTVTMSAKAL